MSLQWIHENPPRWDQRKASVIGDAPQGIFETRDHQRGEVIPGEWWRVEDNGTVLGYGWMDIVWGDAEILLAVDPAQHKRGVGTFILDRLEQEAAVRGLNYMYNVVRPTHPDRAGINEWLRRRGFEPSRGDRLMRRVRARRAG